MMPLETYEDPDSDYDVNSSVESDGFDDETAEGDGDDD